MTKQTYVRVGGVWKPCTSIWTRAGGVWKQDVMLHVKASGVFKECMQYVLYLVSVNQPPDLSAENGTSLNNVNLSSTLRVNLSDGSFEDVPVTWTDDNSYNSSVNGSYQFTANYELPEGVIGTKPVITILVTVFEFDLAVSIPRTSSVSAFAVSTARDVIWTFDHGLGGLNCNTSKDSSQEVAFAGSRGASSSYQDVRILNKSGQAVFSISRSGWQWRDVSFIGTEKDIVASGTYSSNWGGHSIMRWARHWNFSMVASHGAETTAICPDSSHNLFSGGVVANSISIAYFNGSDGSMIWGANHTAQVRGVHTNSISYLTVGSRVSNLTTRKYNASGSLQWSRDHGHTLYDCVADSTDSHNVATGARISNLTTRKYSGTGALNWSVDFGSNTTNVDEKNGKLYVSGQVVNNTTLKIYNLSNGALLESHWFFGVVPTGIRCF